MTTKVYTPASSTDIFSWEPIYGSMFSNNPVYFGQSFYNTKYHCGIRFPNVDIVQGQDIVSASLTIVIAADGGYDYTGSESLSLYYNNSANAVPPVNYQQADNLAVGLSQTYPTSLVYTNSTPNYGSLGTTIQLLVDNALWVSGNAMMFIFKQLYGVPAYTNAIWRPYNYDLSHLHSLSITYYLEPTIISFTPDHGPVGTVVTITGTNFSVVPTENLVGFNGVLTTAISSTITEIVASVPVTATTGLITVNTPDGTATSANVFTVTTQHVSEPRRLEAAYNG